ncbi:hypothetical protein AVEN_237141-1 [Araneus ventricosus]|uniref:Uncharacterized protein n=1 Tax=Araneus ventricosus TaxID=182803 RepID=A0A4Y2UD02_ARAVE|nr:hypothetical protein AVEN_237141-1 [Araneus ventricosus]
MIKTRVTTDSTEIYPLLRSAVEAIFSVISDPIDKSSVTCITKVMQSFENAYHNRRGDSTKDNRFLPIAEETAIGGKSDCGRKM